jgi:Type II secretion system (T2SS), protein N
VKRGIWIALLALLAFVVIFVARMPAAWVVPNRGQEFSCATVEGSLWSGSCSAMIVERMALGDVSWQLHPARLLLGALATHLSATRGVASFDADVEVRLGNHLALRQVHGELPLDPNVIPGVPATLRGRVQIDLELARIERGVVSELKGRIEVHDLEDRAGNDTPLGSYQISFPGGTEQVVGTLHDLNGPLALEGTLRLTRQGGYEVEGLVAARAGAAPELTNNLRFLGSPDATGRRAFSLAGTF